MVLKNNNRNIRVLHNTNPRIKTEEWARSGEEKSPPKTRYDGRESKRRYKLWHKGGAAVGFLIRIIQGEMAPGLGEISTASAGLVLAQSGHSLV